MSTEFYCEEFPTEQNGKPVQTLKDLLEACPEDRFHFMTPFGYVDLNAQDAERLRQGAAAQAHTGESGWEIPSSGRKTAAAGAGVRAERLRMVNGTRLPQIRSRKCRNRSRCRRCSCDRQRVPRRRARVGGLCGFRGHSRARTRQKPENRTLRRRAGVLRKRHSTEAEDACGRLSAEGEAASGEAGESQGVVRAPWQSHLPAVRAVWDFRAGVVERAKTALLGSEAQIVPLFQEKQRGCAQNWRKIGMANKKIKFPLWLMPDTKATVECLYRQDGCSSQSEFIEKAILFYCGYLQS